MASIIPIGNKFRAQIRTKGHNLTKSFTTEKAAKQWGKMKEAEIETGLLTPSSGKTGVTISEIMDLYPEKVRDIGGTTLKVVRYLKNGLGHIKLDKLTSKDIIEYIECRDVSPATALMEISILTSVLKMAKIAWRYHVPSVMADARESLNMMGLIGKSKERERRPTPDELELIQKWFDARPVKSDSVTARMNDIIMFSIYTTRRRGETLRIRWDDFNEVEKTLMVRDCKHPKKKKGNHKIFPLLDAAVEIIKRQPRELGCDADGFELIFPYSENTITNFFWEACKDLKIKDLRFHDLRHEGISLLFEMGYQIHEVAMFSGHEDWKMLKRYTQLKAKDLRRLEAKAESPENKRIQELEALVKKLTTQQPEMA